MNYPKNLSWPQTNTDNPDKISIEVESVLHPKGDSIVFEKSFYYKHLVCASRWQMFFPGLLLKGYFFIILHWAQRAIFSSHWD